MTETPATAPQSVSRVLQPARASDSPNRDRLERAAFRRGWTLLWERVDAPDAFTSLVLSIFDDNLQAKRRLSFTRRSANFDEAKVAEGVAEWIMDPLPEGGAAYRPGQSDV